MRALTKAAVALLIAGAAALAITGPASATYNPLNCGSPAGNAQLYVKPLASIYYGVTNNSTTASTLQSGIRWRPPTSTVTPTWYYGELKKTMTVYSPQVSNINFPSQMYGLIKYSSSLKCEATVAAALY